MPIRYRDLLVKKTSAYRRRWGVYCSGSVSKDKEGGDDDKVVEKYIPLVLKLFLSTLHQIDTFLLGGSDEDEDTANADERRGIVETDIVIRNGTLTNKTLGTSKQIDRLEATRILTPRDFERLKELQKKANTMSIIMTSAKFYKKLPFIQYTRLILKSLPCLFRLGKGIVHFFIVKNALFEVWLFCKVSKNAQ